MPAEPLTYPRIAAFWLPLAGTWLMMAVEGPYLAAIIARLGQPTENLAAFGVAFALAIIIEAPVIMLMAASTALVTDAASYAALRRFTYTLSAALTLVQVVAVLPPVFDWIAVSLIGLPPDVARLTHHGLAIMLPWPMAIGYRRFRQGLLIRRHLTRLVTCGTALRLAAMSAAALVAAQAPGLHGVHVGTIALATGVIVEALASRVMTRHVVASLQAGPADPATADRAATAPADPDPAATAPTDTAATDTAATDTAATDTAATDTAATDTAPTDTAPTDTAPTEPPAAGPSAPLTMPAIFRFYLPLAMTSVLAMGVQPAVTFFVGQSRFALESLAVLPVIHGLTFMFRALGLSYQEVGIALFGDRWQQYRPIRNFGCVLAAFAAGGLGLIVFTPLAVVWFQDVSGLSSELAAFAVLPAQILALLPAGSVWICFSARCSSTLGRRRRSPGPGFSRSPWSSCCSRSPYRCCPGLARWRRRPRSWAGVSPAICSCWRSRRESCVRRRTHGHRRPVPPAPSHSAGDAIARSTRRRRFAGRSSASAARCPVSDIFRHVLRSTPSSVPSSCLGAKSAR